MPYVDILIDNRISCSFIETDELENVIFCRPLEESLNNVSLIQTKDVEFIHNYLEESTGNYLVSDITLDNGTVYSDVRFKMVTIEEGRELPVSTINLATLGLPSSTDSIPPVQLLEEDYNLIPERVEVEDDFSVLYETTKIDNTSEIIQKVKRLENKLIEEQEKINHEKVRLDEERITLDADRRLQKTLEDYKSELLQETFLVSEHQKEILEKTINGLGSSLQEQFDSQQINVGKYLDEISIANLDELKKYQDSQVSKIKGEITSLLSEHKDLSQEEINKQLLVHTDELEKLLAQKLTLELESHKRELSHEVKSITTAVDKLVEEKLKIEAQNIDKLLVDRSGNLQSKFSEDIDSKLEENKKSLFKEFESVSTTTASTLFSTKTEELNNALESIINEHRQGLNDTVNQKLNEVSSTVSRFTADIDGKLPQLDDTIKDINKRIQNLVIEKKNVQLVVDDARKYTDTKVAQVSEEVMNYARRILDLGGGGGSNAVQYANGGTMNGDLNITGQYLSGGVSLFNILSGAGGGGTGRDDVNTVVISSSANWNNTYTSWSTASATSIVSFNDTRFSKLSSQAYTLVDATSSIQPIRGGNVASGKYSVVASGGSKVVTSGGGGGSPLTNNLLAYYKLDNNGSGGLSLIDSTGNSNTLTNNSGVALSAGKINGAANSQGGCLTTSTLVANSSATISCWLKTPINGSFFPVVVDMQGCFQITANTNGSFGVFNGDGVGWREDVTGGSYADGNWHHVAITRDGSTVKLYVDGNLIGSSPITAGYTTPWPSDPFISMLAYSEGAFPAPLDALLDEVGIWNRALSPSEVTELYNSNAGLSYPFGGDEPVTTLVPANTASGDYSFIAGGSNNNTNNQENTFILGSNITALTANYTYVNNLSSLGIVTATGGNSTQWNTAYSNSTVYASNSASYATTSYVDSNFLNLTGGIISGPVRINNNLTVFGNLTATGTTTFANTVFSVTSALSVIHVGSGPAMYIGNSGDGDIASFYDLDQNIEVFHIGGNNGSHPNVGVKTSEPNKTFTVVGEISATSDITTSGKIYIQGDGNSDQWNTAYQSISSNAFTYDPSVSSIDTVNGNNIASGIFSGVLGGNCNTASGLYSTVVGGFRNTASGIASYVASGSFNNASAFYSNVAGGYINTTSGLGSNVAGGFVNTASGRYSTVVGGFSGCATGYATFVGAGSGNRATSDYAVAVGGRNNRASGNCSTVSGGAGNTASSSATTVGGGCFNTASGGYAVVAGGRSNSAPVQIATVGGGFGNSASGYTSTIAGGCGNRVCSTFFNNPNNSFIGGGNTNITFGLNSVITGGCCNVICGIANSNILGGCGNLNPLRDSVIGGGIANHTGGFAPANITAAASISGNGTQTRLTGTGIQSLFSFPFTSGNVSLYYATPTVPLSSGVFTTATIAATGTNFIVVNGDYSTCTSAGISATSIFVYDRAINQTGYDNVIGGGKLNTASGCYSVVVGGVRNTNSGNYHYVGGGAANTISTSSGYNMATIVGGCGNIISSNGGGGFVGGGANNCITNSGGGFANGIGGSSFIGGGRCNVSGGNNAVVVGGRLNSNSSGYSLIVGGQSNSVGANSTNSTLVGGIANSICNSGCSFIGGGWCNRVIAGNFSSIVGGRFNYNPLYNSNIVGGAFNHTGGFTPANITFGANLSGNGTNTALIATGIGSCFSASGTTGAVSLMWMTSGTANSTLSSALFTTANVVTNAANCIIINGDYSACRTGLSACSIYVYDRCLNIGGCNAFIGGGILNTASGNYSFVGGGRCNRASGNNSIVVGGNSHIASGFSSVVLGGGNSNTASGSYSIILGGFGNNGATSTGSAVLGGQSNLASGSNAVVLNGIFNTAAGNTSTVSGYRNRASGTRSSVLGGFCNTASGNYSFVAGGSANDTKGFANTFILGSSLSATKANYTYVNNLSVQGNIESNTNYVVTVALTANQTANNASDTTVALDPLNDPNNWFDRSTRRLTPTIPGYYHVDYQVAWVGGTSGSGNQNNIQIRRNATSVALAQQPISDSNVNTTQNTADIAFLNGTTDYLEFIAYSSNAAQSIIGTSDGAWTKVEVFKIN